MPHTLGNQRLNSHKINIHTLIQPAIELHSHHFYELVYVLDGSAMETLGDTTVQVNKGDYFIIDLVGLPVIDADSGVEYGKVSDVFNTGASDIYTVKTPDGE